MLRMVPVPAGVNSQHPSPCGRITAPYYNALPSAAHNDRGHSGVNPGRAVCSWDEPERRVVEGRRLGGCRCHTTYFGPGGVKEAPLLHAVLLDPEPIGRSGQGDAEMSLICLSDFEAYAKDHLPKATWEYYAAGADDCCTRDDNLLAFKRIRLRPRMLRDVAIMDTRTTVLGTEINCPIGIAPTAFHCLAWPDGEMSTARAAESLNLCYVASTYSTCSVEEIVTAAPDGFRWFQLYVYRDRKLSEQLVHRVEALGFKALVLTVDVPYTGKRRSDIRNNFRLPPHLKVKNFEGVFEEHCGPDNYGVPANTLDPSISWKDIYWLRSITRLPIIIKGILTKEDAELAVEHGVQGIIVSNHGGRQLDGELATIDALSEIVDAVQGRIEVYIDGGIRTGSDVLKALALGAKCVFIGRPIVWGLAYKGEEGVRGVLQILTEEFRLSMALSGCRNVSEINRNLIQFAKL